MKKVWKLMVVCIGVLMIAGCGGKEQTVKLAIEQNGAKVESELEAKGDIVTKMTQTTVLNLADYSEEQIAAMEQTAMSYEETLNVEGAEYTYEITDTELKEVMSFDFTNKDMIKSLAGTGMLPVDGEGDVVSLKLTVENLESSGMEVVE